MYDHRGQRYQHIRQNICRYNIVFLISDSILNGFVIDDVSDHHIESIRRNAVGFLIFLHSRNCTGIQIGAHRMFCSKLQSDDGKDSASRAHIQQLRFRCHIFFQLTDAELCCLVHTGSEGCARINMDDHLVFVLFLHFFPGRNDQNVVHIELLEIRLPVIDPVLVLCLGLCDRTFSQIQKFLQFIQRFFHIRQDLFLVVLRLQIEVQISHAVVLGHIRQDIHEHLLLVIFRQRLPVLNLHALDAGLRQRSNDDVFHFRTGLQGKFVPFHRFWLLFFLCLLYPLSQLFFQPLLLYPLIQKHCIDRHCDQ